MMLRRIRWMAKLGPTAAALLVLALLLTVACQPAAAPAPTAKPAAPTAAPAKPTTLPTAAAPAKPTAAPAAAPTAAPAVQKITFKGVTEVAAPQGLLNLVLDKFTERAAANSGGRLVVEPYKGTLGTGKEVMEGVVLGSNQMAVLSSTLLIAYVPEVGVLGLPYVFKGRSHYNKVLHDSPIGKDFDTKANAKGLKLLSWFSWSPRAMGSGREVHSVADMKGLKVRVQNDPTMISTYTAFGASPTPIAWGEAYMALKQGVVDAVDTTVADGWDAKFHEVTRNLILLDAFFSVSELIVNKKWFDGLPADMQAAILKSAKEATDFADTEEPKLHQEALAKWKSVQGMKVISPDLAGFREAVKSTYSKYYDQVGKETLDTILKLGEAY